MVLHRSVNYTIVSMTELSCCVSAVQPSVLWRSGVLRRHLFDTFHWLYDFVRREGLFHLPVLVHLMDALCHRDSHLLGRHAIVLPFCLLTVRNQRVAQREHTAALKKTLIFSTGLTISSVCRTLLRCTVVPDEAKSWSLAGEASKVGGLLGFPSFRLASDTAEQTFRYACAGGGRPSSKKSGTGTHTTSDLS